MKCGIALKTKCFISNSFVKWIYDVPVHVHLYILLNVPAIHKDVLPTFQQSNVVYEYVCHCDSRHVGRTSQHLQDRIRQYVPKSIRNMTGQERKQPERPGKSANSISAL